jgi:hypothetical protein
MRTEEQQQIVAFSNHLKQQKYCYSQLYHHKLQLLLIFLFRFYEMELDNFSNIIENKTI